MAEINSVADSASTASQQLPVPRSGQWGEGKRSPREGGTSPTLMPEDGNRQFLPTKSCLKVSSPTKPHRSHKVKASSPQRRKNQRITKVTFIDEVTGDHLARIHYVESYKKYNADISQKCQCQCIII